MMAKRKAKPTTLADLKPAPYNPRTITNRALGGLSTSLAAFGDISGIVWNKRTGHVVAGHQRIEALSKKHGARLKIVDGAIVAPGGKTYPIRVVDWPESKEKAANVAANSPAIAGEFTDGLADIVRELKLAEPDLSEALLFDELDTASGGGKDVVEDEPPEPPEDPITKPGDLWLLGRHRVLCGDSTKGEDVGRVMCGEQADLLLTDPPYGIAYIPETKRLAAKGGLASDKPYPEGFDTFASWLDGLLAVAIDQIRPGGCYYVWMGWSHLGTVEAVMRTRGHAPNHAIVWDRVMPRLTKYPQDFLPCAEFCLYGWVRGAKHIKNNPQDAMRTNVWHVKRLDAKDMEHTTQKPLALAANSLLMSTNEGATVLDVCLGSGWTLIACEQLDRTCVGIEIEPRYVDVIVKRWETLTGKKAKRDKTHKRTKSKV
jgi:DNA modification methylase